MVPRINTVDGSGINTQALNDFIAAITTGTATPGVVIDGPNYTGNTSSFGYGGFLNHGAGGDNAPMAYVNFISFDRDFAPIEDVSQTNFVKVTEVAREDGSDGPHERLFAQVVVKHAGYMYVYLSNDNPTPVEVYFDDFSVQHVKGPVVQADDYYPYGLRTSNSYSRENSVPNKLKLFQGQEHIDDLGLNWDSYRYRNHDPAIGRFMSIDPMASAFYYNSPYAFSENKVTTHREMEGLEAYFIHGTNADNSMWKKDITDFIMRELQPYVNSRQDVNTGFQWNDATGGPFKRNWTGNSGKSNRAAAARMLAAYIMKTRKEGQGITLVTHSHGGNVAIQAARILFEKHNTTVNIIGFNTPAFNGATDRENPWDNFGIDEMIHFFTEGDNVADGAGWGEAENKYGGLVGSNVQQIGLKNPLRKDVFGLNQHFMENVNWQEVLSQFGAMMNHNNSLGGSGEKRKKKQPDADEEACKRSGGCK